MAKKTSIEMILEQCATGREIMGTVVTNKVDGNKPYKVTSVNTEDGTITLTEELPKESEEIPNVVIATVKNADAFTYERNPNPKPAPEAVAVNGELIIRGKHIVMGSIKADKVLGGFSGKVLFLDGRKLITYDVQFDKFDTIGEVEPSATMFTLDNMAIIVENVTEEVPQVDKNGDPILDDNGEQVVKTRFVKSNLSQCEDGFVRKYNAFDDDFEDDEDDEDSEDDENDDIFNKCVNTFKRPISSIRAIDYGRRKAVVVVMEKDVDENGYIIDSETAKIVVINSDGFNMFGVMAEINDVSANARIYLGGKPGSETVTAISNNEFVLFDRYGVKRVDANHNADIIKALKGFKYFCGEKVSQTEDGTEVVITFANDNYECRSIKLLKTKDRGNIYSLA